MRLVNRCAIVLTAKQPFADWINQLPEPDNMTLAEVQEETTLYLMRFCNNRQEAEKYLKKVYRDIFEQELFSWWTDPNDWPSVRDYKNFRKWFDVDFRNMVFDLASDELISE